MIDFLLTQECTVKPLKGIVNGDPVYGTEEIRKCRLQRNRNLPVSIRTVSGTIDNVEARAKMYTVGESIPTRSLVYVDGQKYIVLNCYTARGFDVDHLEVDLQ